MLHTYYLEQNSTLAHNSKIRIINYEVTRLSLSYRIIRLVNHYSSITRTFITIHITASAAIWTPDLAIVAAGRTAGSIMRKGSAYLSARQHTATMTLRTIIIILTGTVTMGVTNSSASIASSASLRFRAPAFGAGFCYFRHINVCFLRVKPKITKIDISQIYFI